MEEQCAPHSLLPETSADKQDSALGHLMLSWWTGNEHHRSGVDNDKERCQSASPTWPDQA